jgi:hypothetical protein
MVRDLGYDAAANAAAAAAAAAQLHAGGVNNSGEHRFLGGTMASQPKRRREGAAIERAAWQQQRARATPDLRCAMITRSSWDLPAFSYCTGPTISPRTRIYTHGCTCLAACLRTVISSTPRCGPRGHQLADCSLPSDDCCRLSSRDVDVQLCTALSVRVCR